MGPVQPAPGCFLVLEGIDGCGKSTQLEALARWLPSSGLMAPGAELLITREPGGTPLGQALRQLLLHPPADLAPGNTAELLLYAADRAQHVELLIAPALAAGHWVLSDRFSGSTAAYQGYGRGLDLELIASLEQIASAGLRPEITLWLDLPLEAALQRRGHRPADRIEAGGERFLQRVAEGFAQLAQAPSWRRIDAARPAAEVSAAIQAQLRLALGAPP
ncbi:MAG: dTMP kinase [Prochlorococcaceae cyanobacterium]